MKLSMKAPTMLLLRYQRQRQQEQEDHGRSHSAINQIDMRRKLNDRDLKGESHRAATRGTLICIFVCGFLLLTLGLTLLFVGLLVPGPKSYPAPWLVTGPTCIVLGILVLLLSVEIILKLRKISSSTSSRSSPESDVGQASKKGDKQSWAQPAEAEAIPVPVIIQPATPLHHLDPAALSSVDVVQHR